MIFSIPTDLQRKQKSQFCRPKHPRANKILKFMSPEVGVLTLVRGQKKSYSVNALNVLRNYLLNF